MALNETLLATDRTHITAHAALHKAYNAMPWSSDYASIQAAINDASSKGYGRVYVPPGVNSIESTLICAAGVDLELARGAVLQAAADVDVIKMALGMTLRGGVIDCSLVEGYSKAAIAFYGSDEFAFYREITSLENVYVLGGGTGTGLLMDADATNGDKVSGVHVRGLHLKDFATHIHMRAKDPLGGGIAWVTANSFSNIYTAGGETVLLFDGDTSSPVSANTFINLHCQFTEAMTRFVKHAGGKMNFNQIVNAMVYDWVAGEGRLAIELGALSISNRVVFGSLSTSIENTDTGTNNRVLNLYDAV